MSDSIGAPFSDVQVSSIQNNLIKFQTQIRYVSSFCEDCRDGASFKEQQREIDRITDKFGKPTAVIKTRKSLHAY